MLKLVIHVKRWGNRNKHKTPLKLVLIISECFSKINLDVVGPLQTSSKNNKYLILITSICLTSKYPDAIAVENITLTCAIDAMLQIFTKTDYPREVHSNLGHLPVSQEFVDRFGVKVLHSSV